MGLEATGAYQHYNGTVSVSATIIPAVVAKKIRLIAGILSGGAAGATFALHSGSAAGTRIFGTMTLAANENVPLNQIDAGYCDTDAGDGMWLEVTAGAVTVTALFQTIV